MWERKEIGNKRLTNLVKQLDTENNEKDKAIQRLESMNLKLKDEFESLKSGYDDIFSKFFKKLEEELECPISYIKMETPYILPSGRSIEHAKLNELCAYRYPDPFDSSKPIAFRVPNINLRNLIVILNDLKSDIDKIKSKIEWTWI